MEDLTPLYNKEFYLAHLCGEDVVLPIPDGNTERYLAYLCGMDVTIPDVPDGRTETYLAYKCGEDVVLPDPMYRIEFYLAKWCGMDCEVPEPLYRIEYWLAQLANSGELKTVTGNPISVSDALAKPVESLSIEILPYQSGSGDPSPYNVRPISGFTGVNIQRTGKNLVNDASVRLYANWSNNEYGGSAPSQNYNRTYTIPTIAGQTYTLTVKTTDHSSVPQYISFCKSNLSKDTTSIIERFTTDSWQIDSYTFTAEADTYYYLRMGATGNEANFTTQVGKISYFQLELGSHATAYEPYTGTTYSISWQDEAGTVYGGELDVTTGVLTVTWAYKEFDGTENWTAGSNYYAVFGSTDGSKSNDDTTQISNVFVGGGNAYAEYNKFRVQTNGAVAVGNKDENGNVGRWADATAFKAFLAGLYAAGTPFSVCYELATPTTIQLTPTQVDMLLGNNTIWNDINGDMTLEYLADGPADDVDALQILLNNRYVNNGAEDEATDREALEILLGGNTR